MYPTNKKLIIVLCLIPFLINLSYIQGCENDPNNDYACWSPPPIPLMILNVTLPYSPALSTNDISWEHCILQVEFLTELDVLQLDLAINKYPGQFGEWGSENLMYFINRSWDHEAISTIQVGLFPYIFENGNYSVILHIISSTGQEFNNSYSIELKFYKNHDYDYSNSPTEMVESNSNAMRQELSILTIGFLSEWSVIIVLIGVCCFLIIRFNLIHEYRKRMD